MIDPAIVTDQSALRFNSPEDVLADGGHTRWTRSGLRGRDFAGPEVPWAP